MTDEAFNMRTRAPAISFNYAGLEAQATALMSKYEGLVVSEDQVKDIKKEMAEINALKIRLDNARKEAKRQIEAPVKEFEAQVKKICAIFDRTYAALSAQVQAFVEKAREEKREVVLDCVVISLLIFETLCYPSPKGGRYARSSSPSRHI